MISFSLLSASARRMHTVAAFCMLFASACAEGSGTNVLQGTGTGGTGGNGGESSTSSSSGAGGACADACVPNTAFCEGNAVVTCVALATGCAAWSAQVPCPAAETCSGGKCVTTCSNQCTAGATQCSGTGVSTCTAMPNGCTDWSSPVACGAAETCSGGQCVTTCSNQCTAGATQCSGTGVSTCTAMPNGCTDWGNPIACGAAQTCSGGQCVPGCPGGTCPTVGSTLTAGYFLGCALVNGPAIKCWGKNDLGELGLGDINNRGDGPNEMGGNLPAVNLGVGKIPVAVDGSTAKHVCALLEGGAIKCWGDNNHGQLGQGDANSRGDGPNEMGDNLPTVNLGTGKTAIAVHAGLFQTCALLEGGSVKCWGYNSYGGLGLGDVSDRGDGPNEMGDNLPTVNLGTGKTAIALSVGSFYACALLNGGSVKCWGHNDKGQLGLGDVNNRGDGPNEMGDNLPTVNLGAGKTAIAIATGQDHACALLEGGIVKCWGNNFNGELGLGDKSNRGDGPNEMGDNLPALSLGTGRTAIAVNVGGFHACVILDDRSVKCWGTSPYGELGYGDKTVRGGAPNQMGDNLPFVNLGTGKTALEIRAGLYHTCAKLTGGEIKCWGSNSGGELGQGDIDWRGDNANEMGDNLLPISL